MWFPGSAVILVPICVSLDPLAMHHMCPSHSVVATSVVVSTGRHLPICVNGMNSSKIQMIWGDYRAMLLPLKLTHASFIYIRIYIYYIDMYIYTPAFFKRESFADTSWISLVQSRMVMSLPYWLWRMRERWFSALYVRSRLKHGMRVVLCEGWSVCCNKCREHVETWLDAIETLGKIRN